MSDFKPCPKCGMPTTLEWDNINDFCTVCSWCKYQREFPRGKIVHRGDLEKIAAALAEAQKAGDQSIMAKAYRQGYRDGMMKATKGKE